MRVTLLLKDDLLDRTAIQVGSHIRTPRSPNGSPGRGMGEIIEVDHRPAAERTYGTVELTRLGTYLVAQAGLLGEQARLAYGSKKGRQRIKEWVATGDLPKPPKLERLTREYEAQ